MRPSLLLIALTLLGVVGCDPQGGAWKRARQAHTVDAYRAFLDSFPASLRLAEAESLITEVEYAEAVRRGTVEGYRSFLEKRPAGARSASARERLLALLPDYSVAVGLPDSAARIRKARLSVHLVINGRRPAPIVVAYDADSGGAASAVPQPQVWDLTTHLRNGRNSVMITIDLQEFEPREREYSAIRQQFTGIELDCLVVHLLKKDAIIETGTFQWTFIAMGPGWGVTALGPDAVTFTFERGE